MTARLALSPIRRPHAPYKIFDNFYWLGTRQHSSSALRATAGLVIIDTNFAWAPT